jgi:hypothetical protein
MRISLTGFALAAMLFTVSAAVARAQEQPAAGTPTTISFMVAPEGATTSERVSAALRQTKGVTNVAIPTGQTRFMNVSFMPGQVSMQQLAQSIADLPGTPGQPYRATILMRANNLSDAATRDKAIASLRRVQGVSNASVVDANAGIVAIELSPLAAGDRTGGVRGVSDAQIMKALTDSGVEASWDLAPVK